MEHEESIDVAYGRVKLGAALLDVLGTVPQDWFRLFDPYRLRMPGDIVRILEGYTPSGVSLLPEDMDDEEKIGHGFAPCGHAETDRHTVDAWRAILKKRENYRLP